MVGLVTIATQELMTLETSKLAHRAKLVAHVDARLSLYRACVDVYLCLDAEQHGVVHDA